MKELQVRLLRRKTTLVLDRDDFETDSARKSMNVVEQAGQNFIYARLSLHQS
jgi:hypothetical protein